MSQILKCDDIKSIIVFSQEKRLEIVSNLTFQYGNQFVKLYVKQLQKLKLYVKLYVVFAGKVQFFQKMKYYIVGI